MPAIVTILFGLFASITPANQPSPEQLSSFETLARKTETKVIDSKEVGRLAGGECHAVFTTLIVEDSTPEHRRVRGVRIDLTQPLDPSQPRWRSNVYVDEALLSPLIGIFDELAASLARRPELVARGFLDWNTILGSCQYRNYPGRYPLTADYFFQGPDLPVLRMNGVWFPAVMPSQVSDILGKAIDELRAR